MANSIAQGQYETLYLPPLQILSVTSVNNTGSGMVQQLSDQPGGVDPAVSDDIDPGGTVIYGPFTKVTRWLIKCDAWGLSYSLDPSEGRLKSAPSDFVELFGDGAPTAPTQGALAINPAGAENAITYTAKDYGPGSAEINIAYVDPAGNNKTLAVTIEEDVYQKKITASLATGAGGAITTTAAQLKAAMEANTRINALLTLTYAPADGGLNNGSGVVTAMSRAALSAGAGTGVGVAGPGSRYTDYTNKKLYINGGTKAQPAWKLVTSAA